MAKLRQSHHIAGMSPRDSFILGRTRNTLHTWLLAAGSLLLLCTTAYAFGGPTGVIYAAVFGALSLWLARRVSPQMVLAMYKAKPVGLAEFPTGIRMVEEIARRAGLPAAPQLFILPSRMMNAFAVGRRTDSAIAVTDALATRLSARELAGVLAHEISHIAHEDVRVMAFADMVSRFTTFMSTVGLFSLFLNLLGFAGGYPTSIPWAAVLVLLAAPTVGGLLQMALSRTREFDADLEAARLTGDPDGLASALQKLERAQGRLWEGLILPGGRIPDPSILRTHPLTEERVARLRALKQDGDRGDGPAATLPGQPRPRPSLVPGIRLAPARPGGGHLAALVPSQDLPLEEGEAIDDALPALSAPLNPARDGPRLRVLRGGVWW